MIEHLPCNVTAVLYHLHRSIRRRGLHMLSVPIVGGRWEESYAEMPDEEREARFGQWDQMRRFGRIDLSRTLGQIFEMTERLNTQVIDLFDAEALRRYNILERRWRQLTGANIFTLG